MTLSAVAWRRFGLFASIAGAIAAHAGVNVNNGNFYVAYTDFYVPTSGLNLEVTRTYNSRSNYVKGAFGVGWSSELEGYIAVDAGGITHYEGGGGNVVRFAPKGKGWENGMYGLQTIEKTATGYLLHAASGRDYLFGANGKIARISDRNKNYIEFVYGNAGLLGMMRDNFNNQVKVKWTDAGGSPRIAALEMDDKKCRYDYSKSGDLVKGSGIDGVPYDFAYDDEHNLTKVSYRDGTTKEMAYNKGRDWITKFKDRDGVANQYDYVSDKLDPENKFGTVLVRTREGSPDREVSRFWYEFRRRSDGTRYNYRAVTWIRGVATETIFTECCGTPQVMSQWTANEPKGNDGSQSWTVAGADKKTTVFDYYADGLLKRKTTPDGVVTDLAYEAKHRKVASVARGGRKIEYNYDDRGNLAWAFDNSDNRRMDLTYDLKGRITVIQERAKSARGGESRLVYFRYNADGKPVEIKEKTGAFEGSIRIAYNTSGEVTGILNAKGRQVGSEGDMESARRVASTFQNLLEMVQPAGVTLTPEG